ncbi:sulfur carrier protein ThiS [Kordia sp.]|uniref:sulfur carrier protein ThiS n=1 Tax=Kordia sp. TaxID=1965332 RepID=UPI0025C4A54A|nr:sulfur carrier protein ThiS [Kordia sp.]
MITVNINQKQHQTTENSSLKEMLVRLNITTQGIAVAINQNIIAQENWDAQKLHQGDDILIITATQGG